jgi:hypothetical protein
MKKKVIAIVTIVCILVATPLFLYSDLFVLIEYSGYNQLTLPTGSVIRYNEQEIGTRNENYSFCYGGVNNESLGKLEVWIDPHPPPLNKTYLSSFQSTEGASYTYDGTLDIRIFHVYPNSITIFIKSKPYSPFY